MATRALTLAGLAVLATALGALPGVSHAGGVGAPESRADPVLARALVDDGAVTIRVVLDRVGRGSFTARGAFSDTGAATARRALVGKRVNLTETLSGSSGTIVIRVVQRCGRKTGAWRVLRASGDYTGMSGGGTGTGVVGCGGSSGQVRGVYTGTVRIPRPQQYAQPGSYAGRTTQNERVTFDVLANGRSVGSIRIERLRATCTPPLDVVVEPAFLSTYPIAADGSFTATFAGSTIAGRFGGAGATGTVTYTSSETAPYVCTSGSVTWTASTPPPSLPVALPGTYCGSTEQSLGVCLTLAPAGRLTHLRIEARIDCAFQGERAQFEIATGFGGSSLPLRSNLSFEVLGSIEGDASGEYVARGTFDAAGTVSGTLSLYRTSFDDQEGRIYTCKDTSFAWQATRQK